MFAFDFLSRNVRLQPSVILYNMTTLKWCEHPLKINQNSDPGPLDWTCVSIIKWLQSHVFCSIYFQALKLYALLLLSEF